MPKPEPGTNPETGAIFEGSSRYGGTGRDRQSLAFLSRRPVAFSEWIRPRISRHAFIEVVPACERLRVFGVHLSAVHAAWTEQRRVLEYGRCSAALRGTRKLPSGRRIKWRTVQTVLDSGYVDAYRLKHPKDPGPTLPTPDRYIRLDYVFVPQRYSSRIIACDVVRHPDAASASDHFPVVADLVVNGAR
jgi:endonuclease/exonuclease/phosphatase family metal-dependent hydrolase